MNLLNTALQQAVIWAVPASLALLAGWAAVKRKRIAEWRAARKADREGLRAMVDGYPEDRAMMAALSDAVGRITGQVRTANVTLAEQNKVLGTLQARSHSDFEASQAPKFECDSDGRNEAVNAAYAALLGVEKDELLGFRWRSFIPADALAPYLARFKSAADDHRRFDDEITMRKSNGTLIRVRVHMLPFPPDVGPATHWVGVLSEVKG